MYPPLLDPDEEPAVVVVPDVVADEDEEVLEEDMMIETRSSLWISRIQGYGFGVEGIVSSRLKYSCKMWVRACQVRYRVGCREIFG